MCHIHEPTLTKFDTNGALEEDYSPHCKFSTVTFSASSQNGIYITIRITE